jgi:acetyl-CoA carboxylase biotin carboxyl carrier protein
MDLKKVKELIDLMKETGVAEIEVEEKGVRFRVRRGEAVSSFSPSSVLQGAPSRPDVQETVESPASVPEEQKYSVVRSPIVGTFYRSASPDSQPYVEVGDHIKKGQVLCIVEAMKLMNEIEAETEGSVAEICVEDGSPVEYGQTLFKIDPLPTSA